MMNKKIVVYCMFIFLMIGLAASAQELPNIQKVSLHAPANLKIDGKLVEWTNKFEAYNKATSLFYTMCNDNDNLYVVVHAKDPATIKKIISSRIVFRIGERSGKNESVSIGFPGVRQPSLSISREIAKMSDNSDDSAEKVDSTINAMNTVLTKTYKQIEVVGIKEIRDPLISVYNDVGILAAAGFNISKGYTCEIAVPLKYIISAARPSEIDYNIQVEGIMAKRTNIVFIVETDNMKAMNYSTDFSGKYFLAK